MTASSAEHTTLAKAPGGTLVLSEPRLPYHPALKERFGLEKSDWKALVEAIFPNATTPESVILALSYCKARKFDVFKKPVHIVPIWSNAEKRMVDTVWPGIGEFRTTAFRTGEYAGRCKTEFGPPVTKKWGNTEVVFPEWAQVTVFRMVRGVRVEFAGPLVFWLETYAVTKRDDPTPNQMWRDRPYGQVDKCAEAAALRAAFPEEVGSDYIPEEVQGRSTLDSSAQTVAIATATTKSDAVAELLAKRMGQSDEALPTDNNSEPQQQEQSGPLPTLQELMDRVGAATLKSDLDLIHAESGHLSADDRKKLEDALNTHSDMLRSQK